MVDLAATRRSIHTCQKETVSFLACMDRNDLCVWRIAGLPTSSNGTEFGLQLLVQLSGLHDSNEHEDKTSPSAENLNQPTLCLVWEGRKKGTSAIFVGPECTSILVAWTGRSIGPWLIRSASGVCGFIETKDVIGTAHKVPRADRQNHQWLHVYKNRRNKCVEDWFVNLPAGASPTLLAPPIHKLHEIEHHCHHDCGLKSMEKINNPFTCTTVHHGSAHLHQRGKDHRPASGTHDCWERQTENAKCATKLAH